MKNMSIIFLLSLVTMFSSCDKDDSTANTTTAPTDLTVTASVDSGNSGSVDFKALATNAVSYEFGFGNGIYQLTTTGSLTYKYPASGTYTVNVIAKSASGQTVSKSIQVTISTAESLVWSDEFNVNGAPDPAKWGYDLGAGGWGNAELEYYTNRPENVIVSNGTIKIMAKKENFNGSPYTSARLLSKGKYAFKYGKVEISAKFPTGVGTWPALWMLGANIDAVPWPGCGEIDIVEHLGRDMNKIYGTLHYPGRSGGSANGNTLTIANATTEFHKYTLDWTPEAIKLYVDDVLFHTVANSSSLPFNNDFFFIMNVAMGGNFAGPVDPAVTAATMEVDYIRVYK